MTTKKLLGRNAGRFNGPHDGKMRARAAEDGGRAASASLYVMVTPEQKERYEAAAAARGMKMRELVVLALENLLDQDGVTLSLEDYAGPLPKEARENETFLMRNVTALTSRFAQLELELVRLKLRMERRVGGWMHTHNASVNGRLIPLYLEHHGAWQLLYERERDDPSWSIDAKGRLDRLDGGEPGVVVETNGQNPRNR